LLFQCRQFGAGLGPVAESSLEIVGLQCPRGARWSFRIEVDGVVAKARGDALDPHDLGAELCQMVASLASIGVAGGDHVAGRGSRQSLEVLGKRLQRSGLRASPGDRDDQADSGHSPPKASVQDRGLARVDGPRQRCARLVTDAHLDLAASGAQRHQDRGHRQGDHQSQDDEGFRQRHGRKGTGSGQLPGRDQSRSVRREVASMAMASRK